MFQAVSGCEDGGWDKQAEQAKCFQRHETHTCETISALGAKLIQGKHVTLTVHFLHVKLWDMHLFTGYLCPKQPKSEESLGLDSRSRKHPAALEQFRLKALLKGTTVT